jgi:hypothetical protein
VPPEERKDVDIPEIVFAKESDNQEPFLNGGQTIANRNCIRAVIINSPDLFVKCMKSRAQVSSLIEQMAPE